MKNIGRIILKRTSFEEFPLSFQNLTGLHTLRIWGSGMLRLPGSILLMPSLSDIYVQGCQLLPIQNDELNSMAFSNVKELWLIKCNLPDELLSTLLIWFANVQKLRLIKCNLLGSNLTIIPACLRECPLLGSLILNCCKYLREVKGIPPNLKYISALHCESLTSSSRSMCGVTRGQLWNHPHWTQSNDTSEFRHHTLTQNLQTFGLWILSLIKYSISTFLSIVGLNSSHTCHNNMLLNQVIFYLHNI
jgi:hypothetical protein